MDFFLASLIVLTSLYPTDAQGLCGTRLKELNSKLEDVTDKLKALKAASATCDTVPNAWAAKGMPVCIMGRCRELVDETCWISLRHAYIFR